MRKFITFGLILFFLAGLVLVGCGGKEKETSQTEETMKEQTTPAEEAVEEAAETAEGAIDKAEETVKMIDTSQIKKELEESAKKHQGE